MKDKTSQKYAVPALDKGLDILEFLVSHAMPCNQSEIAAGVGRGPNEIYRVLVRLEKRGYVQRHPTTGRYELSLKLYHLSRNISPMDRVRQSALPYMEDLAVSTGQSCYLSMLYQSQAMVIVYARSTSAIHLSIAEGAMFRLSQSTAGKLLLANSNEEVQTMLIEHDPTFCHWGPSERSYLTTELAALRQSGFIVQPNSLLTGVKDYSVLIGQPNAKVIAALSMSTFEMQTDEVNRSHDLLESLFKTASQITRLIAE
ncbi:IclR family transcriptional regulator [Shewanella sp. 10N.286.48.A6]|uniref:IclR family transcriptional regulator n=1 Tax=Shewanella sp. 10N.286.48.A6 TaxID=1880833 RepID=UPI000C82C3D5|nr:IclR family transcriptional regulator [Shewanella sp. 10N.286.48.A6]PMI02151.1 IclR family transcriptional regulator [Shewanella sp. 10N.286.48.A6]